MPIKTLESFLFEKKLVNSSSIEILQNATVGVDVEHYLSRIYTYKKEQFLFGVGGIPSSLKSYIQSDLNVFKEFNIRPVFVIPGLYIQAHRPDLQTNEMTPLEQHLEATWSKLYSKYSSTNTTGSVHMNESFRVNIDPLPIRPIINDLIKYFIDNKIDYIVSPYDASFQLSYLYQNKFIDSIYGSTDLLLTKIDKFILGMEFQSKDFRYVDKLKVLKELNLSDRQFTDISIMIGCAVQPETFSNFPPLPKPNPLSPFLQLSYFKMALDILFQYNTFNGGNVPDLFGYIASLNDPSLVELYFKGHAAIKYMPILNAEGYVELYSSTLAKLNLADKADLLKDSSTDSKDNKTDENRGNEIKVPTEIHSVISQRLPPEIYFYQSLGLLPLDLLEAITLGKYNIRPPLESGLGDGYKKLITSQAAQNILEYQFNIITQLLARYYQVKKIEVSYWFRDGKIELNNRLVPTISNRVSHLCVSTPTQTPFTLKEFYKVLPEQLAVLKATSRATKANDLVATALLRSLFLLGAADNKPAQIRNIATILKKFVEANPDVDERVIQELTLILLLLRTESINITSHDKSYPSVPRSFKDGSIEGDLTPVEQDKISLISRVFSLHSFNIHPINYQGPISRSLLSFRSHLKFVQQSLVSTLEACLVDLIVKQDSIKMEYKTKEDWYGLITQIPFYNDLNNTLLGVVGEIYFEHCMKLGKSGVSDDESISKAKEHLLDRIFQINNPSFNINLSSVNSITPRQFVDDFKEGVKFWKYFQLIATIAHDADLSLISQSDLEFIGETAKIVDQFSAISL